MSHRVEVYTLCSLIAELERVEQAPPVRSIESDRLGGPVAQIFTFIETRQKFHPDTARMPGIDRIEVLCDGLGNGTGLTVANVKRLRAVFWQVKRGLLEEADSCSLLDVASTLEAGPKTADCGKRDSGTRKRRRRVSPKETNPLTAKEAEAVHLVGEHKGNFAAAGRAAGKSGTAMRKLYEKAMKKLGKSALPSPKTKRLPSDRRGQPSIADRGE
jgi:hypothetical protein